MTPQDHAKQLLEEWNLCVKAKPKSNAVDIQLDKDLAALCASNLMQQLAWGNDNEIQEACYQFESRLQALKEKLVIEVLKNGFV